MNFENSLANGKAKKIVPNKIRALSIFKSSIQAIETAKTIQFNQITLKSIFRELYEGLREYCEAIGYLKGYKFMDHYRKLRNGINYYGEDVDIETVKEAIIEIPQLIQKMEKYSKSSSEN
ncbi:hypothetical protein J4223_02680 [Candidatus Woesearchaeota archaeon]|nr:hypothetical protein [Candidatus Woesearchaeota archaeon]